MAILLAQHKPELGNKEIYQVNIVSDSHSIKQFEVTELHMFFQIRDVLPPAEPQADKPTESRVSNVGIIRRSHRGTSSAADYSFPAFTKEVDEVL